jgi:hypothetical protein
MAGLIHKIWKWLVIRFPVSGLINKREYWPL